MTFYTVLALCDEYDINPKQTLVTISRAAEWVGGTTADLREGAVMTLDQLFYGMMLPSGNDAAFTLAEYFGQLIKD